MSGIIKLLRTEPALILALVQAALSLLIGLGWHLTAAETGSILAVVSAVSGLVVAVAVRDVAAATITGLLSALGTLLITFGVPHVTSGRISEINAVVVAILALVLRASATPKARSKLSR